MGSDEAHYTASKIYPNLMAGRPYVSLFHAGSSAHAILAAAGGGVALAFDDAAGIAVQQDALERALERIADAPESFATADPAAYAAFTNTGVAGAYAALFDRLTGQVPRPAARDAAEDAHDR